MDTAIQSDHRVAESFALFFSARAGVMMLGHGFLSTLGQPMVAAGAVMAIVGGPYLVWVLRQRSTV